MTRYAFEFELEPKELTRDRVHQLARAAKADIQSTLMKVVCENQGHEFPPEPDPEFPWCLHCGEDMP